MKISELNNELNIKRIIIWGLRTSYNDTLHFIQRGFFVTLKKLDIPVIWVNDEDKNRNLIKDNDLIIATNRAMKWLPNHPKAKYCLHNPERSFVEQLKIEQYILLQVLTFDRFLELAQCDNNINQRFYGVASYDHIGKVLHQSWGTPYLESEFMAPTYFPYKKSEYFVGTIWNNELNHGNTDIISSYRKVLNRLGCNFLHVKGAPEFMNPTFIRHSAIGSSIVGNWQRINGYTPCRLFKAVSFGQLGSINSESSKVQYPWVISNENIGLLANDVLSYSEKSIKELIRFQQLEVANETYECKIKNIQVALLSGI